LSQQLHLLVQAADVSAWALLTWLDDAGDKLNVSLHLLCRYGLTDTAASGAWSSRADFNAAAAERNFEVRADQFADIVLAGLGEGASCVSEYMRATLHNSVMNA
jgi:hypothetical protein